MNIERGKILTAQEALMQIINLEQQAQIMGAQDYEPEAFREIKEALQSGKLTPQDALQQAYEILNSKQDYH